MAQRDAAEKVQEGNVNNWVEYYRKQREAADSNPPAVTKGADPGKAVGEPVRDAQGEARK